MQTNRRPFTLIEICIAISILGMLATVVGWNLKKMVDLHHFRKHVALFVGDLQKLQIIAMSRRCDFDVQIVKDHEKWGYTAVSDEPMSLYGQGRLIPLEGVGDIKIDKLATQILPIHLTISPAGRIEPLQVIKFISRHSKEEEAISLDLRTPLLLNVTEGKKK